MQTSSNVAYMPDLYEMKIPLKKSQCAMFRAGNVYPARCRQPGVGAGTTDQWEQVVGRRAGAGGATAHSPTLAGAVVAASPRTAALTRPLS